MIGSNCSPFQTAIQISDFNRPFHIQLLSFLSRPRKLSSGVLSANRSEMDWIRRIGGGCFKDRRNSKDLKVEADSGGEDFFSSAANPPPEHLVIMVNGIIGSAADWRWAAQQFVKKVPDKVIVHRSECNSSKLTFDGVDLMGERLAAEVLAVVRHKPEVRKISFVAHSLGGLVARFAVGKLYEHSPDDGHAAVSRIASNEEHVNDSMQSIEHPFKARIAGLEPMNFITFATPHLGSKGNKQLPFLCGLPFLERRASQTAHLIAGRTGKHLFLNDQDDGKPPLLLQMVNDSDNLKFISALRAFKRRVAYANANYDHMVGWRTSSIRRQNELPPKSNLLIKDEKYPHIVNIERETMDNIRNKASSIVGDQPVDLEEEMIRGLTQVPWERVDVSFRKSNQRYVAHSTIQVKSYWLNSDGADVIFHMIDNFLF
ncbi:alpha/beta-Hydrolases superfamily protein [Melia azedarach]|uniref:Alpha/beta-Hydrolases superfamily protein n=1 Tax=Melia azedarach TaxID=155640 RepID=A0ACC1XDB9_MELAZ|nr:alpha/beta-Hydrolases superfamily protein [Melia azedarach]